MNSLELVCFWASALLLAACFFLGVLALVFGRSRPYAVANRLCLAAFAALTALGIARWLRSGHPPFVTLFESMVISVWFVLLIYVVWSQVTAQLRIVLPAIALVGFLLLGWASSLPDAASPLSAALSNVWLFIHASFATAGAAAFLVASALAGTSLLGDTKLAQMRERIALVPDQMRVPAVLQNLLLFGLVLWGVMIVSGSIWAHAAWGRYWAWDPIELWSLISWLLYGLLIHARMTFKLSARLFCWLTIVAALTVVFALWGVHYVYQTIHTYG